ncbi:DgyrCDS147 [Dimorphilus gyrociliatus]|uniref:DgyrCDS147 n=1 Tax=Dimorphilus gyrociliatus TaxID=2664684 RepID=A0A7I8V3Y1_9ANNE|nr:DgyrCDS147 [Dimorphilus gyrociliatus]
MLPAKMHLGPALGAVSHNSSNFRCSNLANFSDAKQAGRLIEAIKSKDLKTLKRLLAKKPNGLDVFHRFDDGLEKMTALHYASLSGYAKIVDELVSAQADVNVVTPFDEATPLHLACQYPNEVEVLQMATTLIKAGAQVDVGDHSCCTPLIMASGMGHLNVVRLLLDRGAQLNSRACQESYPLSVRWSLDNLQLSEKEADEMVDPFTGNSALLQATREHHMPVVQELLKRGAILNIANKAGNTALHVAAKSESRTIYSDPEKPSERTPVAGHVGVVKALLRSGAILDARNKHGETPLRRAVDGIHEIGEWSVSFDKREKEATTFLTIMQLLLFAGSRPTNQDSILSRLLEAVPKRRQHQHVNELIEKVAKMLIMAGGEVTSEMINVSMRHMPSIVGLLQRHKDSPMSLKQQSRLAIRRYARKPLFDTLHYVHLPSIMRQYVTLEIL